MKNKCRCLIIFAVMQVVLLSQTAKGTQISVPKELGKIVASNDEAKSKSFVVYIQDAHCNYYAQKKIAQLIDYFLKKGFNTVAIEGASGKINIDDFSGFPLKKSIEKASDYFLKTGLISGAEYYAINANCKPYLSGCDDRNLYGKNLGMMVGTLEKKHEALFFLGYVESLLDKKMSALFPAQLMNLILMRRQFADNKFELQQYFAFIEQYARENAIDLESYTHISNLEKLFKLEKEINFGQLHEQYSQIEDLLLKKLPSSEKEIYVEQSIKFKLNKISGGQYHKILNKYLAQSGTNMDSFPNVKQYSQYLQTAEDLDEKQLDIELNQLYCAIKQKYLKTPEYIKLDDLNEKLVLYKKAVQFELSSEEYETLGGGSDFLSPQPFYSYLNNSFDSQLEGFKLYFTKNSDFYNQFYRIAEQRSGSMVENLIGIMERGKSEKAVILAGGFHSKSIERALREKGISFITVAPNIASRQDESPYLARIKGEHTGFEKKLAGNTLAVASWIAEEPFLDSQGKMLFALKFKSYLTALGIDQIGNEILSDLSKNTDESLNKINSAVKNILISRWATSHFPELKGFSVDFSAQRLAVRLNIEDKTFVFVFADSPDSILSEGEIFEATDFADGRSVEIISADSYGRSVLQRAQIEKTAIELIGQSGSVTVGDIINRLPDDNSTISPRAALYYLSGIADTKSGFILKPDKTNPENSVLEFSKNSEDYLSLISIFSQSRLQNILIDVSARSNIVPDSILSLFNRYGITRLAIEKSVPMEALVNLSELDSIPSAGSEIEIAARGRARYVLNIYPAGSGLSQAVIGRKQLVEPQIQGFVLPQPEFSTISIQPVESRETIAKANTDNKLVQIFDQGTPIPAKGIDNGFLSDLKSQIDGLSSKFPVILDVPVDEANTAQIPLKLTDILSNADIFVISDKCPARLDNNRFALCDTFDFRSGNHNISRPVITLTNQFAAGKNARLAAFQIIDAALEFELRQWVIQTIPAKDRNRVFEIAVSEIRNNLEAKLFGESLVRPNLLYEAYGHFQSAFEDSQMENILDISYITGLNERQRIFGLNAHGHDMTDSQLSSYLKWLEQLPPRQRAKEVAKRRVKQERDEKKPAENETINFGTVKTVVQATIYKVSTEETPVYLRPPFDVRKEKKKASASISTLKKVIDTLIESQTGNPRAAERLKIEKSLIERIAEKELPAKIESEKRFAEDVLKDMIAYFELRSDELKTAGSSSLTERRVSLHAVSLLQMLLRTVQGRGLNIPEKSIIVADDLPLSEVIMLIETGRACAFILRENQNISHVPIAAAGYGIPVISGIGNINKFKTGSKYILDSINGRLHEVTSAQIESETETALKLVDKIYRDTAQYTAEDFILKGLGEISIESSIAIPEEAIQAIDKGSDGISLFRSEFYYIQEGRVPEESEQISAYEYAASKSNGKPFTIRIADLSGDKNVELANLPAWIKKEPVLDFYFNEGKGILKRQIRSILRSSAAYNNIQILIPMVRDSMDTARFLSILNEAKDELRKEGLPFYDKIKIGAMVESLGAVNDIDGIFKSVDFVNIGSNDLLADIAGIPRDMVANIGTALDHIDLLEAIARVTASAQKSGKEAHLCGFLAEDISNYPILLGLGVKKFSMNASLVPIAKYILAYGLKKAQFESLRDSASKIIGSSLFDMFSEIDNYKKLRNSFYPPDTINLISRKTPMELAAYFKQAPVTGAGNLGFKLQSKVALEPFSTGKIFGRLNGMRVDPVTGTIYVAGESIVSMNKRLIRTMNWFGANPLDAREFFGEIGVFDFDQISGNIVISETFHDKYQIRIMDRNYCTLSVINPAQIEGANLKNNRIEHLAINSKTGRIAAASRESGDNWQIMVFDPAGAFENSFEFKGYINSIFAERKTGDIIILSGAKIYRMNSAGGLVSTHNLEPSEYTADTDKYHFINQSESLIWISGEDSIAVYDFDGRLISELKNVSGIIGVDEHINALTQHANILSMVTSSGTIYNFEIIPRTDQPGITSAGRSPVITAEKSEYTTQKPGHETKFILIDTDIFDLNYQAGINLSRTIAQAKHEYAINGIKAEIVFVSSTKTFFEIAGILKRKGIGNPVIIASEIPLSLNDILKRIDTAFGLGGLNNQVISRSFGLISSGKNVFPSDLPVRRVNLPADQQGAYPVYLIDGLRFFSQQAVPADIQVTGVDMVRVSDLKSNDLREMFAKFDVFIKQSEGGIVTISDLALLKGDDSGFSEFELSFFEFSLARKTITTRKESIDTLQNAILIDQSL